jgi:hypothetical protein
MVAQSIEKNRPTFGMLPMRDESLDGKQRLQFQVSSVIYVLP